MCWATGQVRIWYNNKNKIYKKIQNIYNHCTDRPQWSWSNKIISVFFFDLTNYSFWSFEKQKTKGRYWKGCIKGMSLTIVLKRMFVIIDRLKATFLFKNDPFVIFLHSTKQLLRFLLLDLFFVYLDVRINK